MPVEKKTSWTQLMFLDNDSIFDLEISMISQVTKAYEMCFLRIKYLYFECTALEI